MMTEQKSAPSKIAWEKLKFVDIEGNGYWDKRNGIVEIAIVWKIEETQSIEVYHKIFKPHHKINRIATKIHGITNEQVENAPSIVDCSEEIRERMRGGIWVGHNIKGDKAILEASIGEVKEVGAIDTMAISKRYNPSLASYKLENLIEIFNIKKRVDDIACSVSAMVRARQPHSAVYDAVAAMVLYEHLEKCTNTLC